MRSTVLRLLLAVVAYLFVACSPVEAQHNHHGDRGLTTSSSVQAVGTIRVASDRFQDIRNAVAAGYRQVGPDFPGMGEHWVNIRQVIQRDLDLTKPAVLSYLKIGDERKLTGVAYTWPLVPGEEPPEFIAPGLWHTHAGSIDEETLVLNPRGMHHGGGDQPRLAMIHAWVWVDNPAGVFEQDNWALPFLRIGLPVPEKIPPQAGKALFLLTDGAEYYMNLIQLAGNPSEDESDAIRAIVVETSSKVSGWRDSVENATPVSNGDMEYLSECWIEMWGEIQAVADDQLWSKIEPLAF